MYTKDWKSIDLFNECKDRQLYIWNNILSVILVLILLLNGQKVLKIRTNLVFSMVLLKFKFLTLF